MKHVAVAALAVALSALAAPATQGQDGGLADTRAGRAAARAAMRGESLRVIVRLNEQVVPEGQLPAAAVRAQRDRLIRAHARVLGGPAGHHIRWARAFRTIPYSVMQIDAAGFSQLAADPDVLAIQLDALERPTLSQSTTLVQATITSANGYRGGGRAIAVLDTGVERSHAFLGGRVAYEACFSTTATGTYTSRSVCPNGSEEQTGPGAAAPCGIGGCDHGTHVAGIAAGSNGSVSGVAPDASILALQVFSRFDSDEACGTGGAPCVLAYVSDQIAALERVYELRTSFNIAAVNMSLGGGAYSSQGECDFDNAARKAAIDQLRSSNIVTVVSSGNDGYPNALGAPACISSAISVGATSNSTSAPTVSPFSNSASFLTLLAPGATITSSVTGNAFGVKGGTSMAAPHVAGAWAVLTAAVPRASAANVLAALQSTGIGLSDATPDRPASTGIVRPLIRLGAALDALLAATPACSYSLTPPAVTVGSGATEGAVTVTTQAGCGWSAVSHDSFVTVRAPAGGTGSGSLSFTVAANFAAAVRTGNVTIAGQAVSITQAAAPALRMAPDVNNDGHVDLVWQNRSQGYLAAWMMNGLSLASSDLFSPSRVTDPNWRIAAAADMDGNGTMDLVWQEETEGWIVIWKMNGLRLGSSLAVSVERVPDTDWKIVAAQDFNGDGRADLVWHHRTQGHIALWYMDGVTVIDSVLFTPSQGLDTNWRIEAAADFNADGKPDLVWRHQSEGWVRVWLMDGLSLLSSRNLSPNRVSDTNWRIASVADINRDNMPDLVWQDVVNGWIGVWLMNGTSLMQSVALSPERVADTNWRIVGPK